MKQSLKRLLLLLLAAMTVLTAAACTGGKTPDETGTEGTTAPVTEPVPEGLQLVRDGKAVYEVVRPETCFDALTEAGLKLRNALNEATGVEHDYVTDLDYKKESADRCEILLGKTDRDLTKKELETLKENTFLVKIEGNKILLLGTNDTLTACAVQAFIDAYLKDKTGKDVVIPTEYSYVSDGPSRKIDTSDPNALHTTRRLTVTTNNSNTDKEYLVKNTAAALSGFRFADCSAEMIYRFDISGYLSPTIAMRMMQEFRIEVSDSEKGPWTQVVKKDVKLSEVTITIDPFMYGLYDVIYIRLTDPTPATGNGATVLNITITYYDSTPIEENVYFLNEETKKAVLDMSKAWDPVAISGFGTSRDGGMIYNLISGDRTEEQLKKYDGAEMLKGTLTLGDSVLEYEIPKNVTAYDAVPLNYKLTLGTAVKVGTPLHISVTGQEDKEREKGNLYYDLNFPGKVDVTLDYEGYVTTTGKTIAPPKLSYNFKTDRQSKQYPSYEPTDLLRTGNIKAGSDSAHWFKFKFTNTGNTVLDGDGNGTFCFYPELYKKSGSGYTLVTGIANRYIRIIDEVYPGEEGEFWLVFPAALTAGDYRIKIESMVRNEIDSPENYGRTIWDGTVMSTSTFDFKVSQKGAEEEPALVKKTTASSVKRNKWMHYYEEFQSSYLSILRHSVGEETGTIWVQLSPWCNQVVLKMIGADTNDQFAAVSIPVKVESDSLKINLDPDNPSYVVLEDGTRFPAIMAQSMADMRVNITQSPYAADDVVRYLCEMKDLGINVINTTVGFTLDGGNGGQAFDFSMDVARKIGLKVEGFVSYPYLSGSIVGNGVAVSGNKPLPAAKPGEYAIDIANGLLGRYHFLRWGDTYWVNGKTTVLSVEDSRGGFGITTTGGIRPGASEEDTENFLVFVKSLYGTIEEVNKAWGTKFKTFSDINFSTKGVNLDKWNRAAVDYDLFQTVRRANNYRTMLDHTGIEGAKVDLRLEGSHWIAKIDPADTRPSMRYILANQHANGTLPLVNCTDSIYCCSDYLWEAYTPSEVAELSRSSYEDCGVVSAMLPLFNRLRDIAFNPYFGQSFKNYMNLTGKCTKGVQVNTTLSVYEWWKATYENHGVPGILWSDYYVDGYATATQRREIAFFTSKLKETIATPEGQKWAKEFTHDESMLKESNGVYSYDPEFVQKKVDEYYANNKK